MDRCVVWIDEVWTDVFCGLVRCGPLCRMVGEVCSADWGDVDRFTGDTSPYNMDDEGMGTAIGGVSRGVPHT